MQATHNRLVPRSNRGGPTKFLSTFPNDFKLFKFVTCPNWFGTAAFDCLKLLPILRNTRSSHSFYHSL